MRSAVPRFPRDSTLFVSCVTRTLLNTGSGTTSRFGTGPFLGTRSPLHAKRAPATGRRLALLRFSLGPVLRATLLAIANARRVERGTDDLVADAGQVLHATASNEHDRVFLQIVADP